MDTVAIEVWEKLSEIAAKNGLGIALSIAIIIVFFFLLKRVLEQHDKERERYAAMIDKKDAQLDNHMDHLTGAIITLSGDLKTHDQRTVDGCQRIVEAIQNQTQILKDDERKVE